MPYFRQHDLKSQLSRGELHERFAGNIEKCSHEITFFLKAGSGSMGEGPCRGM